MPALRRGTIGSPEALTPSAMSAPEAPIGYGFSTFQRPTGK